MSIFDRRVAFKPFEYPEVIKFKEAIQHSYWLVSEFNFTSDVQDFMINVSDIERNAIKNAMLAIAQIEVAVKLFWSKIGDKFPKPEITQVGVAFANSEIIHADAYAHLLEVLGLNDEFDLLLQNDVIQGRVEYLSKYLKTQADTPRENYTLTLALFSLFIENVSLFSQFAIIKSFNRHRNLFKSIDNVISLTFLEENNHAQFGIWLINKVREEFPSWFNEEFYDKIYKACRKALLHEERIIDWIFEKGELDFLTKATVKEFIRDRLNESIEAIGGKKLFKIDQEKLEGLKWFKVELLSEPSIDFFHKVPTGYTRRSQSVTEADLF